jgi:hypothetical protein
MKYDKLTDVFSAWADAAAGKSMPHWDEYDKLIHKKLGFNIDTEQDLFDAIGRKWKMQWKMPTLEEEKKEWKENHINEIKNAGKKYVK